MYDRDNSVIYVGQSGNLRKRLASYKYTNPDTSSRKLMRLVNQISSIKYEQSPSVTAAKLRENFLLRQYRPRFNRVNTHPESHIFIRLQPTREGFQVAFSNDLAFLSQGVLGCYYYGAFKGFTARRAIQALLRICWAMDYSNPTIHDIPIHLNRYPPPREVFLKVPANGAHPSAGRMKRKVIDLFAGKSDALINKLCGKSDERINQFQDRWLRILLTEDHQCLMRFFKYGAEKNRKLKKRNKIGPKIVIGQAQLDDLLVSTQDYEPDSELHLGQGILKPRK